ncbi:MAG: hypothetical protein LBU27_00395 [Candidatus Peribacteria bacterium]|nr:hypothetical protein [Candidatus Peribacteria bacterium]
MRQFGWQATAVCTIASTLFRSLLQKKRATTGRTRQGNTHNYLDQKTAPVDEGYLPSQSDNKAAAFGRIVGHPNGVRSQSVKRNLVAQA